jgi:hypothetical protein
MSDKDWRAIVVLDGVKKKDLDICIDDMRIQMVEIEKTGNENIKNKAGLVRNIGMKLANNCDWIGFVDDDDCISDQYITNLKTEIKNILISADVVIFRMMYPNKVILPMRCDNDIIKTRVGISFAIRKYISEEYFFINNEYEDYIYLKYLQKMNKKIVISSYVSYFIRPESWPKYICPSPCPSPNFPRILINF